MPFCLFVYCGVVRVFCCGSALSRYIHFVRFLKQEKKKTLSDTKKKSLFFAFLASFCHLFSLTEEKKVLIEAAKK